jgi:hypothetical protein
MTMWGNGMNDPFERDVILISQTDAPEQGLGARIVQRYKVDALSDWNIT